MASTNEHRGPSGDPSLTGRGSDVGSLLRSTRLSAGLRLETLEDELRIKAANLLAIEEGRAKDLPGPAYALGFVRTYALRLGLDPEEIIRRFKAEHSTMPRSPELTSRTPVREGGVPSGLFVIVGVILALIIWGGWYALDGKRDSVRAMVEDVPARLMALIQHQTPASTSSATVVIAPAPVANQTAASSSAVASDTTASSAGMTAGADTSTKPVPGDNPLASLPTLSSSAAAPQTASASSSADATPPVAVTPPVTTAPAAPQMATAAPPSTDAPAATPAPAAAAGSRVTLQGAGYAWIQVRDGKTVVTERVLRKGDSWSVPNRPGLVLRTGNAGAIRIIIDGTPVALLGSPGEVRRGVPLDPDRLRASLKSTSSP